LGVSFNESNAAYPFAKVQKQFQNGSEDSIRSFFEIIPVVFNSATEGWEPICRALGVTAPDIPFP
jgi:hypothetical protein